MISVCWEVPHQSSNNLSISQFIMLFIHSGSMVAKNLWLTAKGNKSEPADHWWPLWFTPTTSTHAVRLTGDFKQPCDKLLTRLWCVLTLGPETAGWTNQVGQVIAEHLYLVWEFIVEYIVVYSFDQLGLPLFLPTTKTEIVTLKMFQHHAPKDIVI